MKILAMVSLVAVLVAGFTYQCSAENITLNPPVQGTNDAILFQITKDGVSEERFRIDNEGRLYIKGVFIDRIDIPEIRDSLRKIANAMSGGCDCSNRKPAFTITEGENGWEFSETEENGPCVKVPLNIAPTYDGPPGANK